MLVKQKIEIKGDLKVLSELLEPIRERAVKEGFDAQRPARAEGLNDAIEVHTKAVGLFLVELFELPPEQLSVYPPASGTIEEDAKWNSLVTDFFKRVIQPVCHGVPGITCDLTSSEMAIENCFSKDLVRLLRVTVESPRSSSTRFRAWTEFLVRAAIESGESKGDELGRWLEQEAQEPEDEINSMLGDYYSANWVLTEYFRLFPDAPKKLG